MREPAVQFDGCAVLGVQLIAVLVLAVPPNPDLPLGALESMRPLDVADVPILQD
jgi:hypothetical protein